MNTDVMLQQNNLTKAKHNTNISVEQSYFPLEFEYQRKIKKKITFKVKVHDKLLRDCMLTYLLSERISSRSMW